MAALLLPALPGGTAHSDAERVIAIAEHPWKFRLGWLPWQLCALAVVARDRDGARRKISARREMARVDFHRGGGDSRSARPSDLDHARCRARADGAGRILGSRARNFSDDRRVGWLLPMRGARVDVVFHRRGLLVARAQRAQRDAVVGDARRGDFAAPSDFDSSEPVIRVDAGTASDSCSCNCGSRS